MALRFNRDGGILLDLGATTAFTIDDDIAVFVRMRRYGTQVDNERYLTLVGSNRNHGFQITGKFGSDPSGRAGQVQVSVSGGGTGFWGDTADQNGKGSTFLGDLPDTNFVALAFNLIAHDHPDNDGSGTASQVGRAWYEGAAVTITGPEATGAANWTSPPANDWMTLGSRDSSAGRAGAYFADYFIWKNYTLTDNDVFLLMTGTDPATIGGGTLVHKDTMRTSATPATAWETGRTDWGAGGTLDSGVNPVAAPTAPGLACAAAGQTQINVTLTDNTGGALPHIIEISASSSFTSPTFVTLAAGVTTHAITGLTAGSTRYVRAAAKDNAVWSAPSSTQSATTDVPGSAPNPPTGFGASGVNSGGCTLGWTDASSDEDDFEIQIATDSGFTTGLVTYTPAANATSQVVSGLAAATVYYARIRARNAAGNSSWVALTGTTFTTTTGWEVPTISRPAGGGDVDVPNCVITNGTTANPTIALAGDPESNEVAGTAWEGLYAAIDLKATGRQPTFTIDFSAWRNPTPPTLNKCYWRPVGGGPQDWLPFTNRSVSGSVLTFWNTTAFAVDEIEISNIPPLTYSEIEGWLTSTLDVSPFAQRPVAAAALAVSSSAPNKYAYYDYPDLVSPDGIQVGSAYAFAFKITNPSAHPVDGSRKRRAWHAWVHAGEWGGLRAMIRFAERLLTVNDTAHVALRRDFEHYFLIVNTAGMVGGMARGAAEAGDVGDDPNRVWWNNAVDTTGISDPVLSINASIEALKAEWGLNGANKLDADLHLAWHSHTAASAKFGTYKGSFPAPETYFMSQVESRYGAALHDYGASNANSSTGFGRSSTAGGFGVTFEWSYSFADFLNELPASVDVIGPALVDTFTAGYFPGVFPAVPAAPSGLAATAISTSQIDLVWDDNSTNEDDFEIQVSTSAGFSSPTSLTSAANAEARSVTGLSPSTTYYFRIRARNTEGNSAWSSTASATTMGLSIPAAPSGLSAVTVSSSQIDCAWDDNASTETSFELQYAADAGFSGPQTITLGANDEAESIAGLSSSTTYYFRVRAVGPGGPSAWSNTASATTSAVAPPPASVGLNIEPPFIVIPAAFLSIAATSEASGHPARLLGRHNLMSQWRGSGSPVSIDVQVAGAIDTIALLSTNLNDAATWTIKAGTTLAQVQGGSPAFTTGAQPFRASEGLGPRPGYHGLARLDAPQTYPWWRIQLNHAASVAAASILVMGQARVSPKAYSRDATEEAEDLGAFEVMRDGGINPQNGVRMRSFDFDISLLDEADIEALFSQLWWEVGQSAPVLAVVNAKAGPYLHDRIVFGPLRRDRRTHAWSKKHNKTFQILSLI